jgi:uncharacterized protein (TIGR02145 family)
MKKLVLLLTFAIFTFSAFAQWTWQNPLPQGNPLRDVVFTKEKTGYMVGHSGTILKTDDTGNSWSIIYTGVTADLYSVCFTDTLSGCAVGTNGTVLKTNDAGESWFTVSSASTEDLNTVYFLDSCTGFIGGSSGTLLKTEDAGNSWYPININYNDKYHSICFTDKDTGYLLGWGSLLKTVDGGVSWFLLNIGTYFNLQSVYFINANTGFVVGEMGEILRTTDAGLTWSNINSGSIDILFDIYFTSEKIGYIVGGVVFYTSIILKTEDGGLTWTNLYSGSENCLFSIDFINDSTAFGAGWLGGIKTEDAGSSWTLLYSGLSNNLYSVYFTDTSTAYAVGKHGTILKTIDSGSEWVQKTPVINSSLRSVYFIDQNNGYSAGDNGKILKTNDAGETWYVLNTGISDDLSSIFFVNSNKGYAVGSDGVIISTEDAGVTWIIDNPITDLDLLSVCFPTENTGYAVGGEYNATEYVILKKPSDDEDWIELDAGEDFCLQSVFFINEDTGFAAGGDASFSYGNAVVLKTTDGGMSWEDKFLEDMYRFHSIHFVDENFGFAAGRRGLIYKTCDGGENWENMVSLTNNYLWSVFFTDENHGWVVGAKGTILHYSFGGNTNPIITVSPISIEQILGPNQNANQNFTIGNIGVNDLEFEIAVVYNIDDKITEVFKPTATISNTLESVQLSSSTAPNYKSDSPNLTPSDDVVLHYDNENYSAIGWANSYDIEVAAMFPQSITGTYVGMQINSVDVYINDVGASFYLRIYGMGTNCEPGELLVEQFFAPQGASWENIILDEPLNITGEDIWIGYAFLQFPLSLFVPGCDAGPNDPNGDWIKIGAGWSHLSANPELPYNWNIRANLSGEPIPQWLSVEPSGGIINYQATQEINVNFNTDSLTIGNYEANLVIISNDPETPVLEVPISLTVDTATHTINVNYGYQFVSTNVDPINDDMLFMVGDILNENLDFIRNSQGQTLTKIGPNWVNGIGKWIVSEGYLFKMFAGDSFTINGTLVNPITPIPVETGFQFISYLPENPMDALLAFETIIGDSLDFVRNSQGTMIRKIGPNWVNGIGDCQPGEGYLIKMFADGILIYPSPTPFICGDPFTDTRDEQIYNTVQIGEQCWMAENMNIGEMINGSEEMTDNGIIEKYCYENNPLNCNEYGGLYQWNEMMQYVTDTATQGICPEGWHVPSDYEWKILEGTTDHIYPVGHPHWNDYGWRGYDVGLNLKSTSGWLENGNGLNTYGFTALPGGVRYDGGSFFYELGYRGFFWSSYGTSTIYAWYRFMSNYDKVYRYYSSKIYGFSVRCLKDSLIFDKLSIWNNNRAYDLLDTKTMNNESVHFIFKSGNPAEAVYTLYIKGLKIGDEVAAFDGDKMVGSVKINSQNPFENELPVFSTLINGQGYEEGNPIILKVWSENKIVSSDFTMETIYDAYVSDVYPVDDGKYSIVNITKVTIENMEERFSVYPNPSKGISNISHKGIKGDIQIKVFDLRGKEYSIFELSGTTSTKLDLTKLTPGVYFISFRGKDFRQVKKIVIK